MKILAAVVTHNRRELLARCLDHLEAQKRVPDAILVIDNASSDGTAELLAARGIDTIRQDNLGSAGGWHRAIATALEQDFDAIWLMDDDGFPDHAALGRLEAALVPGIACASAVVVCEHARDRFVFPFPVLNRHQQPAIFARPRKLRHRADLAAAAPDGTYPFAHLFNGALISTAAARQIGNVETGYFMFGDEVDYFCRLRAFGQVISVLDVLHYHPDVSGRPYTPAKVYYYVKNSLICHRRYFDMPALRNGLAIAAVLARVAARNGVGSALGYIAGRQTPALARAISRGLGGRIGKDFDA
jgi:rhamnopyranosyl-N-acetylglucosaminyl-diphospho-decaprenol beta-1,3/1,4-galactofuranosyltransferase